MIGLDTNITLRWLLNDAVIGAAEPDQKQMIDRLMDGQDQVFVNQIVLVELVWILKNRARLSKSGIIELLNLLLAAENVVVHERAILLSSLSWYSLYPGDFTDHLIGETNRQSGCETTFTFDKAAAKSPNFSELKG